MQRDSSSLEGNLSNLIQAETFAVDQQGIHRQISSQERHEVIAPYSRPIRNACSEMFALWIGPLAESTVEDDCDIFSLKRGCWTNPQREHFRTCISYWTGTTI